MLDLSPNNLFRATLIQLDDKNQARLEEIIHEEVKTDEGILAAAENIMEMIRDPNIIKKFLGEEVIKFPLYNTKLTIQIWAKTRG